MYDNIYNKIIVMNKEIPNQPRENDYGNKEYKWKLFMTNRCAYNLKCQKLASQMKFRLCEGNGHALYLLGICDDGFAIGITKMELFKSILFIIKSSDIINSEIKKIRLYKGFNGYIASIKLYSDKLKKMI